MFGRQFKSNEF